MSKSYLHIAHVHYLKTFLCYLGNFHLELFYRQLGLKILFLKKYLSRREPIWLHLFGQFHITKITLRAENVLVLDIVPSQLSQSKHKPDVNMLKSFKEHCRIGLKKIIFRIDYLSQ